MSRCIFSSLLLLFSFFIQAQEQAKPKGPVPLKSGIRIGVDLANYVFQIVNPSIVGFEASIDYEWRENLYFTVEGGFDRATPESDFYNYELSGGYGRIGIDFDIVQNTNDLDIIFVGFRYASSFYNHSATDIQLESYWGDQTVAISENNLNAHWLEGVFGMKAELFFAKNVFIGWSIRGKVLVGGNNYNNLEPYVIPGYARTDSKAALGVTWSLFYNIPVSKR